MTTALITVNTGCVHEPIMGDMDPPPDTTITDTTGNDTTTVVECDSTIIYFEKDILPILRSNCAISGCHTEESAEDGVILTNYDNVMMTADVRPFDLDGSDLYEVITEDDPDKIMPRPPNEPLTGKQINLIARWILEGAENLQCDESNCDLTNVTYSGTVSAIIETNCRGCHSGGTPSGGILLTSYDNVKMVAMTGQLEGAIKWLPGFTNMPFGQPMLPECNITQIEKWIEDGTPNN